MTRMSEYDMALFEVLAKAAVWPQLRGRVASCGVMGVVTAALLSPNQSGKARRQMVDLISIVAVDDPEYAQRVQEPQKRAHEFEKLRK